MSPTNKAQVRDAGIFGDQIPFENIKEPGTYVSNWTGHLIRVPGDALKQGNSPTIAILGKEPMVVSKVSDDPFINLTRARMLAADLDLNVNF